MHPTRRRVLGSIVAGTGAVGLAGCLDGAGPAASPTDTATGTAMDGDSPTGTATGTDGSMGATVQVASHPDHGDVLVGPAGLTLYMFDSDTKGEGASTCTGSCADAWPPLTVEGSPTAGDGVTAELATFERDTGETQVSAAGWPLYYFANDEGPGDANGQGVNDVWWVLQADGTPVKPNKKGSDY